MLRILIADDHEVLRRGLRWTLEQRPGWTVCGEAADGREAVALAASLRPDVVVLDVGMPGLNGLEALRRIRKASPSTEILVFTVHGADGMVGELLAAGAKGYLLKSDAARCILPAVEALSRHRPYFTEHVSEVLLGRFLRPDAPAAAPGAPVEPPERLTPREREIVQLLAEGSGTKEIARRLGVGTETVRTHRAAVMKKLGVHSVVEVVRYAVRNGLTPI